MTIHSNGNGSHSDETFSYVLGLIQESAQDWDLPAELTPDSRLFSDLGMQSLEAVVLATKIQEHYGQNMPFAELFADLGRTQRDLTIRELAGFVAHNRAGAKG